MKNRTDLTLIVLLSIGLTFTQCLEQEGNEMPQLPNQSGESLLVPTTTLDNEFNDNSLNGYDLAELLDSYGGHDYDPQRGSVVGISDEELASINPSDLYGLIELGKEFALTDTVTPRYLFEIGRIALFAGDSRATEWLEVAAGRGSAAAYAYLGYDYYYSGDSNKAFEFMKAAVSRGFDDPLLLNEMQEVKMSVFDPKKFNKSDLIEALYLGKMNVLKRHEPYSRLYIGQIQNSLMQTDILFLVSDHNILLDLDPRVSVKEGNLAKKWGSSGLKDIFQTLKYARDWFSGSRTRGDILDKGSVIIEQATQDARRMALMYETNNKAFTQIYDGLKKFSNVK